MLVLSAVVLFFALKPSGLIDLKGMAIARLNRPAVFVYDGYPGGVGLSRKGYDRFKSLLETTARIIRDCPCEIGCPGCIQSPKCGNGNKPLDKAAGLRPGMLQPRRRHLFQTLVDMPVGRDWPFVWHNDLDVYFRPEGDGLLMSPCDATKHPPQPPVVVVT